ncbi:hypothetical protein OROHE_001803 [Orobanche hederae]
MAAVHNRFMHPRQPPAPRRKIWAGCWGGLSFFRKQKGCGKRIVPAFRIPETNALSNQSNGPHQAGGNGLPNQTTGITLSLLAPPSSPASFSNSALPSTAQSPATSFLSANSPGGPPSTMFVTGPYANETQLVSPPVFSTFTTEPSTAPLTPPPELAHLTTPSSPDVPYAHFLSRTSSDCLFPSQWTDPTISSQEGPTYSKSNFFCPETFAQFYLDQSSVSNAGGRLSISRESDGYSNNGGNGYQNRQRRNCKPAEELEAYRASFGFSADEIIATTTATTTNNYVEISDLLEGGSFSITPLASGVYVGEECILTPQETNGEEDEKRREDSSSPLVGRVRLNRSNSVHSGVQIPHNGLEGQVPQKQFGISGRIFYSNQFLSYDDSIYSKKGSSRVSRKHQFGSSNSDAEIEYRRGSSLRERRKWRES